MCRDRLLPGRQGENAVAVGRSRHDFRSGGWRGVFAEAEVFLPPRRGRRAAKLSERTGRDRGRNVAVTAKPTDAPEIELGIAAGSSALGVGVDRCLIGDKQVYGETKHRPVRLEDQMLDCREVRLEWTEQLAVDLMRQRDVERIGHALAVLD